MISRFREYDAAFDPSGSQQFILGGTIAKNLLRQDGMVLDASVQLAAAMRVLELMVEIKEICNKYKVVD